MTARQGAGNVARGIGSRYTAQTEDDLRRCRKELQAHKALRLLPTHVPVASLP